MCGATPVVRLREAIIQLDYAASRLQKAETAYRASGSPRQHGCSISSEARDYRDAKAAYGVAQDEVTVLAATLD